MVHIAIKVEKQLQGRGTARYVSKPYFNSNSTWKRDGKSDFKGGNKGAYELQRERYIQFLKRNLKLKSLMGEIETLSSESIKV